jgi:hypothetical protein
MCTLYIDLSVGKLKLVCRGYEFNRKDYYEYILDITILDFFNYIKPASKNKWIDSLYTPELLLDLGKMEESNDKI